MLPNLTVKSLKAAAVVTATAQSSALDLSDYEGPITIILDAGAQGSGITNAIKIKDCDTSGGSYNDVTGGGFTSVGNAASFQEITLNSDEINQFIKLDMTVSGGSGTGIVSATVVGVKKYR